MKPFSYMMVVQGMKMDKIESGIIAFFFFMVCVYSILLLG